MFNSVKLRNNHKEPFIQLSYIGWILSRKEMTSNYCLTILSIFLKQDVPYSKPLFLTGPVTFKKVLGEE